MTAVLISTSPTRLRLTTRGRRVLAALAALPVVVGIFAAVLGGGSALASRVGADSDVSFSTVTVQQGESLWAIATEVAPQADPRDVMDAISRLNALDSSVLSAGQRLAIPAEYTP